MKKLLIITLITAVGVGSLHSGVPADQVVITQTSVKQMSLDQLKKELKRSKEKAEYLQKNTEYLEKSLRYPASKDPAAQKAERKSKRELIASNKKQIMMLEEAIKILSETIDMREEAAIVIPTTVKQMSIDQLKKELEKSDQEARTYLAESRHAFRLGRREEGKRLKKLADSSTKQVKILKKAIKIKEGKA